MGCAIVTDINTNTITTSTANTTTTTGLCLKTLLQILPRALPTYYASKFITIELKPQRYTKPCHPKVDAIIIACNEMKAQ